MPKELHLYRGLQLAHEELHPSTPDHHADRIVPLSTTSAQGEVRILPCNDQSVGDGISLLKQTKRFNEAFVVFEMVKRRNGKYVRPPVAVTLPRHASHLFIITSEHLLNRMGDAIMHNPNLLGRDACQLDGIAFGTFRNRDYSVSSPQRERH
jgi:hypothetical protein